MVAFDRNPQDFKYLRLLSRQFPTEQSAFTEIINLSAILNLPKGTEHFMSDVHGEYEAFMHILNSCSGVVREHVDEIFGDTLSFDEKGELCTLIYYPREKIELVRSRREDSPTWYKTMLDQLIVVARSLSSRYTRSKVRKAIPRDYAYIIDELLHTHPDENNYRVRYHERIIESILETASADDFIESLASLIKRLAVDHLHLVGDIFDRGGGAAKIMDRLLTYHSLDIQWGNHDLLWMGAAAGEPACIATVLRNNLRYDNYEILENDYGISLRELVAFADATYTAGESITPLIKAINVLLFKLEGQIIQRHPEFDMTDRLLLDKIDHDTGTVTLADGSVWPLATNDFPTVDPTDPYTLTPQEQHIIDKLVSEFVTADHLHRHIDFLYTHGSMYKVTNGNLLFHGCVPLNEDGTFSSMNCLGTWHAGRDYLDFCDRIARRAWRVGDRDALDWMWYLWIGFNSPRADAWCVPLSVPISPIRAPGPSRWTHTLRLPSRPRSATTSCASSASHPWHVRRPATSSTVIRPSRLPRASSPSAPTASCWSSTAASVAPTIPRRASPATRLSRARADAVLSRTGPLRRLPRRSPATWTSKARPTALTRPTAAAWSAIPTLAPRSAAKSRTYASCSMHIETVLSRSAPSPACGDWLNLLSLSSPRRSGATLRQVPCKSSLRRS